jgi:hypothetical protein
MNPKGSPMRRHFALALVLVSLLAAACTLTAGPTDRAPASTSTIPQVMDTPAPLASAPAPGTPFPTVETDTGPYADHISLLDGVCFEFLATLGGSQWTWTSPEHLAAFFDRVDESELCPGRVARGSFVFEDLALVGAVNTATGCDAAHRVIGLDATTQTLQLAFDVLPGCDYELVQPFLIAVPRPPDRSAIQVVIIAAPGSP